MGGKHEHEGEEDSMPQFFAEDSEEEDLEHDDQTVKGSDETQLPKPHSKSRSAVGVRHSPTKASGSSLADQEHHTCPICSKQLKTDNQGLNAHIDFCLSKGAILEAQAEASKKRKR